MEGCRQWMSEGVGFGNTPPLQRGGFGTQTIGIVSGRPTKYLDYLELQVAASSEKRELEAACWTFRI